MTISSTTNRTSYSGNGVTTVFSFPYRFLADADLVVIEKTDSDGTEVLKTLTTHYTVSGAGGNSGGSVTMLTAPASGKSLIIYRDPALAQDLDLVENDPLPAEEVEKRLDKAAMWAQRLKELVTRSVRLKDGSTQTFDPSLPPIITADRVVKTKSDASGFEMGPTADEISSAQGYATDAGSSANAAASSATLASDWAQLVGAAVTGALYSAKEWAVGTFTRGTLGGGSAKDWATYTGGTVDNSEYSAKKYATDAASSAATAAAQLASAFFRDTVFITSASSPVTLNSTYNGKLLSFDSSGGAIVVNLPQISGITLPFNIGFLVETAGNSITINRAGTDTIGAAGTSKVLSVANTGCQLTADSDPAPDRWSVLEFGSVGDGTVTKAKLAAGALSGGVSGSKTSAYTLTSSDDVVRVDTSGGAFTLTLPTAVGISGKIYEIIKTSNDLTACTIDGNGTETLNGALTTNVCSRYEAVKIVSDGANWLILHRRISSEWISFTPTVTNVATSSVTGKYKRVGDSAFIHVKAVYSGVPTGSVIVSISGLGTIDTGKVSSPFTGTATYLDDSTSTGYVGSPFVSTSTTIRFYSSHVAGEWDANAPIAVPASPDWIEFDIQVPITGWEG